ncbi:MULTISPECIES: STAS/SEC14 domain-containing protein [unclassified Methanoculleus]|jgi:hypothetical protein|uniref:STAS/SEC14 domain-containing protein n=1 Tax=Methanoculleus palmolei TaxID=72612 RepID=A0ABD8AB51_9EURY|nr:STAS/SEC14 domain-containing protein [Methanoculleus sp. UBA377]WOX56375.1 STAS/SEC14 domain-containing protein [Methanoculleus palmolei]
MLEEMETGAGNVVGFRFDGEMTARDYNGTLIPALKEAGAHPTLRMLFYIVNFHGWRPHGHWETLQDRPEMERVDRIALVGEERSEEWLNRLPGLFVDLTGTDVRHFPADHLDAALDWVREPTE